MYAVKFEADIPESHHLVLEIPQEIPAGHAEILVTSVGQSKTGIAGALAFLKAHPLERKSSSTEIEERITNERNSWE